MQGRSRKGSQRRDPRHEEHITPLIVTDRDDEYSDAGTFMDAFLAGFRGGLIAPTRTTYDTIALLLTAETERERNDLTRQWRDHKLEELNFIGVVGALLAGCLTSTGSWPAILPNGKSSPWPIQACWYCGIVFALFSVLTAAQQSMRLHRLSAHRDGLLHIRHFMGSKCKSAEGQVEIRPRRFQTYCWQASIMFLTLSVFTMVLGMCITVWSATKFGPYKLPDSPDGWWDGNAKLAVTWSIITLLTFLAYMAAQVSLAMRTDLA